MRPSVPVGSRLTAELFEPSTPAGTVHFGRLVHVAESIKIALTDSERVKRYVPGLTYTDDGQAVALEAIVARADFNRLIKDKVDRTIDCCRDALAQARDRAGVGLSDVDYVVLVGGSSRVPLVRETVQAAFCNPDLAEHVRSPEPLLHEPDLCVAYGAALRAASHGTHYLFAPSENGATPPLDLHVTSPANIREPAYPLTGVVRTPPEAAAWREGGSVRVRSLATGLMDEAFLDERGSFVQDLELQPETDNALELAVCDGEGREAARTVIAVRCQSAGRALGRAVLPTQIITKPLQIEVLGRDGRRVKQVVAPIGAVLPGTFQLTCRTHDQAGRIVVPIFEENRVVKQMIVSDLDPLMPVGSPVEVELAVDVKYTIEVRVRVRQAGGRRAHRDGGHRGRAAAAQADAGRHRRRATPNRRTAAAVQRQFPHPRPRPGDAVASGFARSVALQRRAEGRPAHGGTARIAAKPGGWQGAGARPPWPRFAQLVRRCLDLAAEAATATGRERDELLEHVQAQERYAEQAFEDNNQALYRECRLNLEKYVGYLDQLLRDALPRPSLPAPQLPPEEEAKDSVERFRNYLAAVWKQVRSKQRTDLETRLTEIAGQARGLSQRMKTEPLAVVRDARRLGAEVHKVEELLKEGRRLTTGDDAGLLEGTS